MGRHVIVNLTIAEARELYLMANLGWGDGDGYQMNNEGHPSSPEEARGAKIYGRAIEKLQDARRKAEDK